MVWSCAILLAVSLSTVTGQARGAGSISGQGRNVELIGRWAEGPCQAVAAHGHFAFMGNGAYLSIVDFSNTRASADLGRILLPGVARDIVLAGELAYVADDGAGLRIIDVADPSSPREIGVFIAEGPVNDIALEGNAAYLAAGIGGLVVIDVSDPTHPIGLGRIGVDDAVGVAVSLPYVFVAERASATSGLHVFTTEPTLSRIGYVPVPQAQDVVVSGTHAYLAAEGYGLRVIDVSDPYDPAEVASVAANALGITVIGDLAYVADPEAGIRIVDISDPPNPKPVNTLASRSSPCELTVEGRRVYVAGGSEGLEVLDASNPDYMAQVGQLGSVSSLDAAASGDYAYLVGSTGLVVVDVSDPSSPVEVARRGEQMWSIALRGNHVYVAAGSRGIEIYDVSLPEYPRRVANWEDNTADPFFDARDIALAGDYAYVTDRLRGFRVFYVAFPSRIVPVGVFPPGTGEYHGVAVSGEVAYLTENNSQGPDGLRVVDVSAPYSPVEIAYYEADGARKVDVDGSYVYLAANPFRVLDVSDPAAPAVVSTFGSSASDIQISGTLAYAVVNGFSVFDVTNPASPRRLACKHYGEGGVKSFAIDGDHAYLGMDNQQMVVLSLGGTPPSPPRHHPTSSAVRTFDAAGDHLFVLDRPKGVAVFDVADLATPKPVGLIEIADDPISVATLEAQQHPAPDYLLIGHDGTADQTHSGITVLDISTPLTSIERSRVLGFHAPELKVRGTAAYVADGSGSLVVIDLTDPARPVRASQVGPDKPSSGLWSLRAFDVSGDYGYGAWQWVEESFNDGQSNNHFRLMRVDVSDPFAAVLGDEYYESADMTIDATEVAVAGGYAYVTLGAAGGLDIFDVSDDQNPPMHVRRLVAPGEAYDVTIFEGFAFLAAGRFGLRVLDISDPTDPQEVGFFDTGHSARQVKIFRKHIWVADDQAGLYILGFGPLGSGNPPPTAPPAVTLHQNYPNPFNPETTIQFALDRPSFVELDIYDVGGRFVRRLVAETMPADTHDVTWDGSNSAGEPVSSGVYFYRLRVGGVVRSKKMILIK